MKLNLKNRIAFYYMLLTAALVALVFVFLFTIVERTVYNHLDAKLVEESDDIYESIEFVNNKLQVINEAEWNESEHAHVEINPTFVEVRDALGAVIKQSNNLSSNKLQFKGRQLTTYYVNSKLSETGTRQIQRPIISSSGQLLGFILVALPREESVLVLSTLRKVLYVGYPLVLIFLFAFTRIIAGSLMLPINRIINSAEQITRENLDDRVPVPKRKDELYTLATSINDLLDRLNDVIVREQQFTSNASHELRTPLSVIKGTLEVLIRKPRDNKHYERKVNYCIDEVNRMSILVDQLLMLARHESGQENLNERIIVVEGIITDALVRLQDSIAAKKLKVHMHSGKGERIKADPFLVETIFENVLSNAVKYSEASKNIFIEIFRKNKKIVCSVRDEGKGMHEDEIKMAFHRFYRTKYSRDSKIEGSGIGLALIKRLAELQGIHVELSSEFGSGTTFTLSFPSIKA